MAAKNGSSNKPVAKFRLGYVTSTIWFNDPHYNVVLTKSYKDDQGDYKDTDQLGTGDLCNAMKVLERSEQFIADQQ